MSTWHHATVGATVLMLQVWESCTKAKDATITKYGHFNAFTISLCCVHNLFTKYSYLLTLTITLVGQKRAQQPYARIHNI